VKEFKFGRGYDNGPIFGDVTGRLASGITLVNQPVVCYYTHEYGEVIERRIHVTTIRLLRSTISEFFSSNLNNRVFFYQAVSMNDGTIYSAYNGNIEQMPMTETGMVIRASVVNLD
jgi:hypothetical protein